MCLLPALLRILFNPEDTMGIGSKIKDGVKGGIKGAVTGFMAGGPAGVLPGAGVGAVGGAAGINEINTLNNPMAFAPMMMGGQMGMSGQTAGMSSFLPGAGQLPQQGGVGSSIGALLGSLAVQRPQGGMGGFQMPGIGMFPGQVQQPQFNPIMAGMATAAPLITANMMYPEARVGQVPQSTINDPASQANLGGYGLLNNTYPMTRPISPMQMAFPFMMQNGMSALNTAMNVYTPQFNQQVPQQLPQQLPQQGAQQPQGGMATGTGSPIPWGLPQGPINIPLKPATPTTNGLPAGAIGQNPDGSYIYPEVNFAASPTEPIGQNEDGSYIYAQPGFARATDGRFSGGGAGGGGGMGFNNGNASVTTGAADQIESKSNANKGDWRDVLQSLNMPVPNMDDPQMGTNVPSPKNPASIQVQPQYPMDRFLDRIIQTESSNNPNALSHKGASGLMQILPSTASELLGRKVTSKELREDVELNLRVGRMYLQKLWTQFNDPRLVSAAYNAGPGRVNGWLGGGARGRLPKETLAYVSKVTGAPVGWEREYIR
jgi:hypothetical protein